MKIENPSAVLYTCILVEFYSILAFSIYDVNS